jgi:hypothetical protein
MFFARHLRVFDHLENGIGGDVKGELEKNRMGLSKLERKWKRKWFRRVHGPKKFGPGPARAHPHSARSGPTIYRLGPARPGPGPESPGSKLKKIF